MASVTVQLDSNVAEVLKHYQSLPKALQKALTVGLRLGLHAIRGGMIRKITTNFRTTTAKGLRQSIEVSIETREEKFEGKIFAAKNYAKMHEFGTVGKGGTLPDIVPVRAKALRFEVQTASRIAPVKGPFRRLAKPQEIRKVIFSQRVSIPARPFFFPAIEENIEEIPKQIRNQINNALEIKKS